MESKTVRCPACGVALVMPLTPSRGVAFSSVTHQCRDKSGGTATSVFKLSHASGARSITLSTLTEFT